MKRACAKPITVTRIFPIALSNGVYFIVIIKKTSLCEGNSPIADPITEMGVAHAFDLTYTRYRNAWVDPLLFSFCVISLPTK